MGLEEQLLATSLIQTIHEAHRAEHQLSNLIEGNTLRNVEERSHAEQLQLAEDALAYHVEKVFRDVAILAERMRLPQFAAEVMQKRAATKNLSEMELPPDDVYHVCAPLRLVSGYFESLQTMVQGRAQTGLAVFERVLRNTGKIIISADEIPQNEAKVRAAVRNVLELCFDDVVKEIPIPKNIKTYKPDIGITSLMAAAEYKFIDSKAEAKKSLDEIYADMKGYHGRYDWRSFYAVFYMTEQFYSQREVEEEFRLVKAELSWTPIVVVGPGARK